MGKENKIIRQMGDKTTHLCLSLSLPSPSTTTLQYIAKRTTWKNTAEVNQENMSESCGSNAFPNAEVEKQKTNKKRTGDVEDEVLSTTQKPYKLIKMTEPSHWSETQKINIDSQPVQETEFTQEPYRQSPWLETQNLYIDSQQPPEEQFGGRHAVNLVNREFVEAYANMVDVDDINLVSDILIAAKQKNFKMDMVKDCSEMESSTIAKKINKTAKTERVNGPQVCEILNFLRFQFLDYCKLMGRGVAGLNFDFDNSMFTTNSKANVHEAALKNLTRNIAMKHKHAIQYFQLLKDIGPDILCKYRTSNESKQQRRNSRSLSSTGGASSSGKRKSSSNDTSKSVKKPVSLKNLLIGHQNRPPTLSSLAERMEQIFHPIKSMGDINKLLDSFKNNKYLLKQFMAYDNETFKNETIRLKRMNVDGGGSSER